MKKSKKVAVLFFCVCLFLSAAFFVKADVENWTILPAGLNTGIKFGAFYAQSIAYGNGVWVVVGEHGYASYSYNGIDWTTLPMGDSTGIKIGDVTANSITYGGGKFIVVGNSGKASYSTDGINWTSLPAGTDTGIKFGVTAARSVTYSGSRFVVVGSSGKASYSDNGIDWTVLTPGTTTGIRFGTATAYSVTYGGDKFVVVGGSGRASYSTDGIDWTALPAGLDTGIKFGTFIPRSVVYGSDKFVVVGGYGYASYSTDGIDWTILPMGLNTGIKLGDYDAYSVAYGNNKFVVIGGFNSASYSTDGISWTALPSDEGTGIKFYNGPISIAYGGGKFIIVGYSSEASYCIEESLSSSGNSKRGGTPIQFNLPSSPKASEANPLGEFKLLVNPATETTGRIISNQNVDSENVNLQAFAGDNVKSMRVWNGSLERYDEMKFDTIPYTDEPFTWNICKNLNTSCKDGEYDVNVRFYTEYNVESIPYSIKVNLKRGFNASNFLASNLFAEIVLVPSSVIATIILVLVCRYLKRCKEEDRERKKEK